MTSRLAVISFLVVNIWLLECRAQLGVSTAAMQSAVNTLAQRFSSIRNEGLGIDSLEVSF